MSSSTDTHRQQLKIVIVGHVDHGKSTLVGRLFYDTDSLPEGKYEAILQMCKKRGMPFEWSFLMDALQAERDQGITIDTTQIWFKTPARDYVIIDAPGHKEFLKNMVSGAASSEAALLVIDAEEGVREQSRRHGYLLHLLGVRQIAVVVNKMDRVGYSQTRFEEVEREYRAYLKEIGVEPTYIIPVSAREGDAVAGPSANMPWYTGPSVLEALDAFTPLPAPDHLPLRFPIQDIYKFDERRILVGRIESGTLRPGDSLVFSPSGARVAIASIEAWPEEQRPASVSAGMSVGVTLEDQIFVERGHIASHVEDAPVLTNIFRARIFWLGTQPLVEGKRYRIKQGTAEYQAEVRAIEQVVDTENLSRAEARQVMRNSVAEVVFRIRGMAAMDDFSDNPRTGRFVILDGYDTAGGGIIDLAGFPDQRVQPQEVRSANIFQEDSGITPRHRARMNSHLGGILWFTGLSGSGKSTLAKALQQRLFSRGLQVYVLDGDNIRRGLNKDLDFSPECRSENIRRVGEVSALFADAGVIVITAFISPYAEDRRIARNAAPEDFHTIYIKADLDTCELRDTKGLYARARAGEIPNFTGISDPYEPPEVADLTIDTAALDIDASVDALVAYVEEHFVTPARHLDSYVVDNRGADI